MTHKNCLCGNRGENAVCYVQGVPREGCKGCGWDRDEAARRKALLRTYGLTEVRRSIMALIIKR